VNEEVPTLSGESVYTANVSKVIPMNPGFLSANKLKWYFVLITDFYFKNDCNLWGIYTTNSPRFIAFICMLVKSPFIKP